MNKLQRKLVVTIQEQVKHDSIVLSNWIPFSVEKLEEKYGELFVREITNTNWYHRKESQRKNPQSFYTLNFFSLLTWDDIQQEIWGQDFTFLLGVMDITRKWERFLTFIMQSPHTNPAVEFGEVTQKFFKYQQDVHFSANYLAAYVDSTDMKEYLLTLSDENRV